MGMNVQDTHYDTFDKVLKASKKLSEKEIYHIIRDNEFGTSVKMCECCKKRGNRMVKNSF